MCVSLSVQKDRRFFGPSFFGFVLLNESIRAYTFEPFSFYNVGHEQPVTGLFCVLAKSDSG